MAIIEYDDVVCRLAKALSIPDECLQWRLHVSYNEGSVTIGIRQRPKEGNGGFQEWRQHLLWDSAGKVKPTHKLINMVADWAGIHGNVRCFSICVKPEDLVIVKETSAMIESESELKDLPQCFLIKPGE